MYSMAFDPKYVDTRSYDVRFHETKTIKGVETSGLSSGRSWGAAMAKPRMQIKALEEYVSADFAMGVSHLLREYHV